MKTAATLSSPHTSVSRGDNALARGVTWVFAPLLQHRRALVGMNVAYFGTVAVAGVYTSANPALQQQLLALVGQAFAPTGTLGPLTSAYLEGRLAAAVSLTLLVNLVLGTAVMLTLPSVVIPFCGVAVGLYRAVLWGILFAPTSASAPDFSLGLALPTIVLEGEAYVIAMVGVWLWWLRVIRTPGERARCWKQGVLLQVRIYPAVATVLAVAAVVEASSVIVLMR